MITQDEQNARQLIRTLRESLHLVDLSDLRAVKESGYKNHADTFKDDADRREYVGTMASYWTNGLQKEIERMIYMQEKFLNIQSQNHEQDMLGRGTLNGLLLVWELYDGYREEWIAGQPENKGRGN